MGELDDILSLANGFFTGQDGAPNYEKAFELYRQYFMCKPDDALVIDRIGFCYEHGRGTSPNLKAAKTYYKLAATLGSTQAMLHYASCLQNEQDAGCVEWYEKADECGDVDAPLCLTKLYQEAGFLSPDSKKAESYLKKAAERGNSEAALLLAEHYQSQPANTSTGEKELALQQEMTESGNAEAACLSRSCETGADVGKKDLKDVPVEAESAESAENADALFAKGVDLFFGENGVTENKKQALACFLAAADAGVAAAQVNAGVCYQEGYGCEKSNEKAIFWLEKAAKSGESSAYEPLHTIYSQKELEPATQHYIDLLTGIADKGGADAQYRLYEYYEHGVFVGKDHNVAMRYLEQAVEQKQPEACEKKGNYLQTGEGGLSADPEESVRLFRIAAEAELAAGARNLAECYEQGTGVPQDAMQAIYWYTQAADQEDADAAYSLARLYLNGAEGMPADDTKGISWLERAVDFGSTEAMTDLGYAYATGEYGLAPDAEKARSYWLRGSEAGNPFCKSNLGKVYQSGNSVPRDLARAQNYYEEAFRLGHKKAADYLASLGALYEQGDGIDVDFEKAAKFYSDAYKKGSAEGACRLGELFESGKGVEKNIEKAAELYRFSAEQGYEKGVGKFGLCTYYGVGTNRNVEKGIELMEQAADGKEEDLSEIAKNALVTFYSDCQDRVDPHKTFLLFQERAEAGNPKAQFSLSWAYENGIGVEKNQEQAEKWLKCAAENGDTSAMALCGWKALNLKNNAPLAVDYWEKASMKGNLKVSTDLAQLYLEGAEGVPANSDRAIALLREAAEAQYTPAQKTLGLCYALGQGVEKNQHKARQLFEKSAQGGDKESLYNLQILLLQSEDATERSKAAEWLANKADEGDDAAGLALANALRDDEGIPQDLNRAIRLYQRILQNKSSEKYSNALLQLGRLYALKQSQPEKAVALWTESAQAGMAEAQWVLGKCYEIGMGVQKNMDQAVYWWEQAAEQGDVQAQEMLDSYGKGKKEPRATPAGGAVSAKNGPQTKVTSEASSFSQTQLVETSGNRRRFLPAILLGAGAVVLLCFLAFFLSRSASRVMLAPKAEEVAQTNPGDVLPDRWVCAKQEAVTTDADTGSTSTIYSDYTYDGNIFPLTREDYNASGTPQGRCEYEYDANNNKIKESNFDRYGISTTTLTFTYNTDNTQSGGVLYDNDGAMLQSWSYRYDAAENSFQCFYYTPDQTVCQIEYSECNSAGNIETTYVYNGNNEMIAYAGFDYPEGDTDGLVKKKSVFDADGTLTQYICYAYDSYGNNVQEDGYWADGTLFSSCTKTFLHG